MRSFTVRAAALIGALAVSATTLSAQTLREQMRGPSTKAPTQVISVNAFLPLFGYFEAECELLHDTGVSPGYVTQSREVTVPRAGNGGTQITTQLATFRLLRAIPFASAVGR